jgi:hypothetical protein
LIDVADYFIDLGEIADKVRKETTHGARYYDQHPHDEQHPHNGYTSPHDTDTGNNHRVPSQRPPAVPAGNGEQKSDSEDPYNPQSDFVRVTDEH